MARSWSDFRKTIHVEDVIFDYARSGDLESIQNLDLTLERIDKKNTQGYSPLMLAAYNGNLEVARYLITKGANAESADLSGSTVLMGAAFKGQLDLVELLLASGAKIEARNAKNQTALDFANMFGRSEVALLLKSKQHKPLEFGIKDIFSGWISYFYKRRIFRWQINDS